MALRVFWPQAKLQTILEEATRRGETRVWFRTVSDAERFRYACYGLRKRKNLPNKFCLSLDRRNYKEFFGSASPRVLDAHCSILVRRMEEPTIIMSDPEPTLG